MLEKCKRFLLSILILTTLSSLNILTISAKNSEFDIELGPPPELTGNKIDIIPGIDLELPIDEPCYVEHATGCSFWSNQTIRRKIHFILNAKFLLGVDFQLVELEFYFSYDKESDIMWKVFYIQFPENYFQGEHYFTGVWLWENLIGGETILVNFI